MNYVEAKAMRLRRPRLTLGVMMAFVLAVGVWLGWIAHQARAQREAVAAIVRAGGHVSYDGEWGSVRLGPRGPDWLRGLIGRDYFDAVISISADTSKADDAVVAQIGRLTQARALYLQGSTVTDGGLAALSGMHELRTLHLRMPNVNGSGLRHLSGLRRIQNLHFNRTPISDESLAYLAPLLAIERLSFSSTHISDAGMTHVAKLTGLKLLTLATSDVGDDGLRELGRIRRPIQVQVRPGTRITPGGINAMRSLAPEMTITP